MFSKIAIFLQNHLTKKLICDLISQPIFKLFSMVRAMCGQKIVDRKTTEEQMDMLGLKETIDRLATANGVRWYGHVLRRDDDSVLRVALNLEVSGKRKRGRPKKTWKKQVEEETEKIGLKKEDALRRDKWRDGVRAIAEGMG